MSASGGFKSWPTSWIGKKKEKGSKEKLLGFKIKMVTHPRHVEVVNHVFTPTPDDIAFSLKMVEAYKEAEMQGKGAAVLDGKMIDVAMYKMGMDMLAKAGTILTNWIL